jgi:hypothetical protein
LNLCGIRRLERGMVLGVSDLEDDSRPKKLSQKIFEQMLYL